MIEEIKNKVISGGAVSPEEIRKLATTPDTQALYVAAGDIRRRMAGDLFDTCSIVNARSGRCSEDCKWCAQSVFFKTSVKEYDMVGEEDCMRQAARNADFGIDKFSFVTSGRSLPERHIDRICSYARKIREKYPIRLCASMGLLNREQLRKLKAAGIERYHCNMETSRRFFPELCTTHTYDEKIAVLKAAAEVGLEVCSGGIIGMGETMEDRIEMALELRALGIRSVPLNVLNPIPGTPLAGRSGLEDDDILRTVALFRFILPSAFLRFAGGRILIEHMEERAIAAGINAAIIGDMLTTSGPKIRDDMGMIRRLGFRLK